MNLALVLMAVLIGSVNASPILSIDTGLTITRVQPGQDHGRPFIVASSYEGTLLRLNVDGTVVWKNKLSGFMNHDVWCADLNGDGEDEILCANADGSVYCLDGDGKTKWSFKANEAPMYSVCTVRDGATPYVVCGGFDKKLYYLSVTGGKLKEIDSIHYSQERPWDWMERNPETREHSVNFVRPVQRADGSEILAVIGQITQISAGSLYQFEPLADRPFRSTSLKVKRVIGSFSTCDLDQDGAEELLLGTSGSMRQSFTVHLDPDGKAQNITPLIDAGRELDYFGYRVAQPVVMNEGNDAYVLILFGSRTLLMDPGSEIKNAEVLTCSYSFNDMCKVPKTSTLVLASAQSGGSGVHLIDTRNPSWKQAYEDLAPPGKIQSILDGTAEVRTQLADFRKPAHERDPLPVYLMSERYTTPQAKAVAETIMANHGSPVFLGGNHQSRVEGFDRAGMGNARYEKKRDKRKRYVLSQEEVVNTMVPQYEGFPGIAYWGGHGNDPNYYQVSTTKKILDAAEGKKTVLIYPEIQDQTADFIWLMNYLMYPLAEYGQSRNLNLYIRSKNSFWHGDVYLPGWARMLSGEFSSVFVPSLEESHSKIQDMSVASRAGMWASGAVDSWGARCARDNTSYDRSREHSHQMLPNHFLRHMIYNVASGAQYLDNFQVDQDYMSLLWELIATGALYVPKRSEIVSFNPVHLGMKDPDHRFLDQGANVHWTVFFDEQEENENPMVFDRMNGSWKGAPVQEWDYSRYASGVNERRLNLLPPNPHGVVMIAPPQTGVFADADAPRGKMTDHLHPLYGSIMKEFITDGRSYLSADGTKTYAADRHYKKVEREIKRGATKLPLTVSGDVAWVTAQSSAKHLRLTLVDSGYINPGARTARIQFHSVEPVAITDVLSGESFKCSGTVSVEVPVGLFRFLDIEIADPL